MMFEPAKTPGLREMELEGGQTKAQALRTHDR